MQVTKKCLQCGATFSKINTRSWRQFLKRKYCSPQCARKNYSKIRLQQWKNPKYKQMMSETHKGQICSFKGRKRPEFSGKNHPRWIGNSPLKKQIRDSFEYRQWRSDIFTRDNFTCVLCGEKGCYIEADHYLKSFIQIFNEYNIKTLEEALNCAEFWNINNGRTLCEKCHNKTKKGRYEKNHKGR